MLTPKPFQERTHLATIAAINSGARRILIQSPTGTGKSFMMGRIAQHLLALGRRVIVYTNRRSLLDQSADGFSDLGIDVGVRAAGHENRPWMAFQISSLQTEVRRLAKPEENRGWTIFPAHVVIIDEAHLNAGPTIQDLAAKHINMGAVLLGYTATPVDVGHMYDQMIQCCTMQEGRESGLLVKMLMFGPDEPDLKAFGKVPLGADISLQKQSKAIMTPTIFGRVFEWWKKLNPDAKPTLGFAPGIQESIGFVEDWRKRGVRTAHIDGDDVYVDGAIVGTDTDTRRQIFDDHKKGRIACIWNRFVLREGIDLKWSAHGILAVTLGSLQTYIQTVGRFARSAEGKDRAVIQDHGGNYWRHGSPNAEREWRLDYTSSMVAALWEDRHRTKRQKEGYRCPGCSMILAVKVCPGCGHTVDMTKRPRCVIQVDGTPKMLPDKWQYKERRISQDPGGPATWKRYILYRFPKTEQNFRQAEACYMLENGYAWPDRRWPYMPIHEHDFFRKVKDVPVHELRSER